MWAMKVLVSLVIPIDTNNVKEVPVGLIEIVEDLEPTFPHHGSF
jgi:hypothetical protein